LDPDRRFPKAQEYSAYDRELDKLWQENRTLKETVRKYKRKLFDHKTGYTNLMNEYQSYKLDSLRKLKEFDNNLNVCMKMRDDYKDQNEILIEENSKFKAQLEALGVINLNIRKQIDDIRKSHAYEKKIKAAVIIQKNWRRWVAMKDYEDLKFEKKLREKQNKKKSKKEKRRKSGLPKIEDKIGDLNNYESDTSSEYPLGHSITHKFPADVKLSDPNTTNNPPNSSDNESTSQIKPSGRIRHLNKPFLLVGLSMTILTTTLLYFRFRIRSNS
jgi:hypothetical protein